MCYVCCKCRNLGHLFTHYPFATKYWDLILEAFGWCLSFPHNIYDLLALQFWWDKLFMVQRKLYGSLLVVFLWHLWGKKNARIFRDPLSYFDCFMDLILFHAIYWCKCKHPFIDYSLRCSLIGEHSCNPSIRCLEFLYLHFIVNEIVSLLKKHTEGIEI